MGRYVFTLLTFAVSGAFHMFNDISQGIPWHENGAVRFFLTQAFGIMFEDALVAMFGRLLGQRQCGKTWIKVLGYVWVLTWLIWSSPVWIYPLVRRSSGAALIPLPEQMHVAISRLFHLRS